MNAPVLQFDAARVRNAFQIPKQTPEALTAQLPDIGDSLSAACASLARDPRADACEILATRLQGIARHVMLLRMALLAQSAPPPAA